MEKSKVIKRMEEPTPVSSHMVVVKQGGKYRICIDPSDLNKILLRRHYPLRTIEDIASNIKNSKYFTKLDFLKGFWQLKVAAETQPYMTFSTPWGRYAFLRVPFGIKTAPEIFQNTISKIVENIPDVENSMDDILIHAEDIQTLRERTKIVMTTLQEAGARLNKDKCEFEKTKIKFLGHIFTSDGIETDEEKVKAIDNIKSPSNKKELQRLLGMVQYLHKFIPNLSEITYRMRLLLKKNTEWQWDSLRDKDMERIKDLLKQAPTLKYYDPNKDVVLSVDTSQHAIGAVLLQEDRPIAYASSALNDAQRHYPQIEKEALAIKFGCKKFHTYIYGKSLLIETDHRPLESIYKKTINKMPPRLQKIFMEINQYRPNIKYKSGKELLIADLLSRDCKSYEILEENPIEILLITAFDNRSTTNIMKATKEDAELQELTKTIIQGRPDQKSLVPLSDMVENCKTCIATQRDKQKQPLMLKEIPELPWEIVASDNFHFEGNEYIVIIDSYSGFINFEPINTINSKDTIGFLKRNFSIHGIPKVLETDNGRNYASREFNEFSNKWKFNHKTSSPHYPKSNGLAERAVQIAKNILRKCKQSGDDIQIALLNYRNTPREDMGSPAQKLLSRRTKTILPISKELLRPCIQKDVTLKLRRSRNKQKFYYDKGSRDEPTFKIGQEVYLRENRRNWKPATIVREDGPRSYTVQNNKGLYRRNQSHITTNQSQRDHESILEQEPSGSACSTMEQDQETQPKGSDRMELQSETDNPAGEEETREVRKFTRSGRQNNPLVYLTDGREKADWSEIFRMVETRSGKMQDPAQKRIKAEESAKPQPGSTIGRDASSDPVVLNPNIDIPKYDGTEDPRPWIESLEEIGFLYHWADYIISRYAAMNMIGSAKTWLNLHKVSFTSWENFKNRLIEDFASDANKEEMRMRLNRIQQWNEPAIRFAEDILVLCNKVDPQMEEETKINWVIGGLKKEYSFALHLNPPKNTNELLEIGKKLDLFEKNYQERAEKSKAIYNGPRSPRSHHQEQWKNATSFRRPYQNTSKPQAPAPRYYQNTSKPQAPTPRYYQNKPLPQVSAPRRSYTPNPEPKPVYPSKTYNKNPNSNRNRTKDGRPICFKCNNPGHVARYCRVWFVRIVEEDPIVTQDKVEEEIRMDNGTQKSRPLLYSDVSNSPYSSIPTRNRYAALEDLN
ncbi:K02A2.6-like [Cordylochernes scorpioides]|uniref:K02A2.6-like n=1 Tax=Cordylochernes scorpioides TaxID=51811 RepID=A0ABY6JWI9_9ARAC|nr:K02A2.6-like [Cordylochernes scorpioides]